MRVRSCSHHQFKTIALQFFQPIALILMLAAAASAQGQAPVILKPPQGAAILVGSTTALNVQASGTNPLTYQWLFNSSPLPNATASSYTISNIQKANEGDYRVIVGSTFGSVTSVVARVTVVAADIPTITDELVAHFIFDGNLNDSTSHSNNGTPVGAPNYTQTGKSSGAGFHFSTKSDGTEFNFATLDSLDDFIFGATIGFSVSFWIRFTTPTGEFPLIANRDWSNSSNPGWGIAAGDDGRLRWTLVGPPVTKTYEGTPGTLNGGVWHHVAVTFQRNGNAITYLDGAVVNTQSVAGVNDISTSLALNIGQDGTGTYNGGGIAGIDAGMDDLGIWRRAITPDEVAWIFAKGARGVNLEQNVFNLTGSQQVTRVTGQWDFDRGDLRATVGQPLEYGDGPNGPMATQTSFNTTTGFGIPDIAGQPAKVMKYLRNETPPDNYVAGYTMHHGIAPNGGGTLVNQWTLIADMLLPDLHQGDQYSAVIEIQNDPNSDADVSIHEESPGVGGIGISGQYPGSITAGEWHRIVVAVDMSGATPVISKFVDGVKAADQISASGIGPDGRFALSDVAHLFSDGEHDNEVNTYYVNSVQIRNGKLSDEEVASLGGPQASGVPLPNQVTGQWDFDQGDLRATIGQALEYGDGLGGPMSTQTTFNTTTGFGIPDIGGQSAKVMKYLRNETPPDNYVAGYTMHHGIPPNGGGTLVNQWTLIADMLLPDLHQGDQYSAVIEIQNDPNSDADVSIHEESPGVGGIGISGQYPGSITAGQWHRIVVAVDMSAATPVISKFVDGIKAADQISASGIGLDARFALSDVAHLFSDGEHDNEVNTYYVNSVQIRNSKLSDQEVAALGGPQANGVPLPNQVTGQWDFDQGDLSATVGQPLEYGDGVGGPMATQTTFDTTTGFAIPNIGGQPAKVMKYLRNETPPDNYVAGYTMHHGIAPNGGGTLVNQWTLIADMLLPDLHQGDQYSAVIEIQNDPNSDADVSIHEESPGVGGIGISGQYPGSITAGQWHRIVVAVDMASATPVISKFVDGVKAADQISASGIGLDARFALSDVAHLFSDGEHDNEVNTYYVNSVQIRSGKLSDQEVTLLGGPQASGIPLKIPDNVSVPNPPSLITTKAGATKDFTLSWDITATGFSLETTSSLTNPNWLPVTGVANNSIIINSGSGTAFYRLKK